MADFEQDDRAAPADTRLVVANGRRYFKKTTTMCTACGAPDRHMYVSKTYGTDVALECPFCLSVVYLPQAAVREAK